MYRSDEQMFFLKLLHQGVFSTTWHETWFYSPEQESFFEQYERQLDPALDGIYELAELVTGE